MFTHSNIAHVLLGASLLVCLGTPADATVIYTGSGTVGGNTATASAMFDITGNTLTITLENTSPAGVVQNSPTDTLSGLFFTLTGDPVLTPLSATIASGSSIIQAASCNPGPCSGVTNVDGEWGYQHSSNERIGSAGYITTGLTGDIGNFNSGAAGTNLDNPDSLSGINFGLVTKNGFNPNGGLTNVPLIEDTVTLTLTGVSGLTTKDISNVFFRYGTSLSEASIPGSCTPPCGGGGTFIREPATLALMGVALVGVGLVAGRRRRP